MTFSSETFEMSSIAGPVKTKLYDNMCHLLSHIPNGGCIMIASYFRKTLFWVIITSYRASLVAQRLKRLPAMQETRVRSLDQEVPLEKEMATHSSILAWKIPWTEEPVGYSPWGCKESDTTEQFLYHELHMDFQYPWFKSVIFCYQMTK